MCGVGRINLRESNALSGRVWPQQLHRLLTHASLFLVFPMECKTDSFALSILAEAQVREPNIPASQRSFGLPMQGMLRC